mmetsp:Transcript_13627/g.47076  ORF Transcript_13627/g.47076 Transcript_13627/m.47076 type:complete len:210 (+) Transcript_13627:973-1602(+)
MEYAAAVADCSSPCVICANRSGSACCVAAKASAKYTKGSTASTGLLTSSSSSSHPQSLSLSSSPMPKLKPFAMRLRKCSSPAASPSSSKSSSSLSSSLSSSSSSSSSPSFSSSASLRSRSSTCALRSDRSWIEARSSAGMPALRSSGRASAGRTTRDTMPSTHIFLSFSLLKCARLPFSVSLPSISIHTPKVEDSADRFTRQFTTMTGL